MDEMKLRLFSIQATLDAGASHWYVVDNSGLEDKSLEIMDKNHP
jgi:hypothetical protein